MLAKDTERSRSKLASMFGAGRHAPPSEQNYISSSDLVYRGQAAPPQEFSFSEDPTSVSIPPSEPRRLRQDTVITRSRSTPRLDGPIVTVHIHYGDDESKTVFVHKSHLCKYSKYFRAALNTPAFAETESQELNLEELGTEEFDTFLFWVYHRSGPRLRTVNIHGLQDLLKLWIFADKYIVPELQNHVMSHIMELLHELTMGADHSEKFGAAASRHPTNAHLDYTYKNTTDGSRLRRVLADWLAVSFRSINADKLPLEMVRDIFKSVQELPDEGGFIRRGQEYYFVNEDID